MQKHSPLLSFCLYIIPISVPFFSGKIEDENADTAHNADKKDVGPAHNADNDDNADNKLLDEHAV